MSDLLGWIVMGVLVFIFLWFLQLCDDLMCRLERRKRVDEVEGKPGEMVMGAATEVGFWLLLGL